MKFRTLVNYILIAMVLYIGVHAYRTGTMPEFPQFTQPLEGTIVKLHPREPGVQQAAVQQPAPEKNTPTTHAEAEAATPPAIEASSSAVPAKPESFATAMHYIVTLSSFEVADIYLGLTSKENAQLEMHAIIRSSGIADIAGGYKSDATTVARFAGGYIPVSYHSQFKLKGDWRTIKLAYDSKGHIVPPEFDDPPEKRWKRKEVPVELKAGALDPLTAALAAREGLKALALAGEKHKSGDKFTIPLYDGRRRADLVFTVVGHTRHGNILLSFAEVPRAGYTDNEIEGFSQNQHVINLEIDPETFMPVRASGNTVLGMAEARLAKQCGKLEECMQ